MMVEQNRATQRESLVYGAKGHVTVGIDTSNEELRGWRVRTRQVSENPLVDQPTGEFSKKELDKLLIKGDVEAAGLFHGAVEEFTQKLAAVTHRFFRVKSWHKTSCIVIRGGFRANRVGELAIGRAAILLKAEHSLAVELKPIRHNPDKAGFVCNAHLIPARTLDGEASTSPLAGQCVADLISVVMARTREPKND